ncbi:hypothetical protein [Hymenobacter actinosclerus]|uniref:Uncharacterized protein n=1 Tax=Hymenobacter actinosclerus TaxID=82805 RepID=A0A1I0HCG5_9BACT|nr:hypothetical protein [Hymenobacter actinosclerus]SET81494.1 hypothetical protein SAMN04487998_2867 [Hymenobacter actinosclerus]
MLSERELGEGYPFHYRKGPSHKDGPLVCTHYYTFRTRKNRRYVVEAEQYQHHVYVLKYYPLALKASPNRFKLLVNDGDAFRILTTCTQIFLDICRRDPLASAGFVGEALPGESWVATKRFRVYLKMVTAFVGPTRFLHHPLPAISAYFLECRVNPEPNLKGKVEQLFRELYIVPQALESPKPDELGADGGN